jgi:hypothetical protein
MRYFKANKWKISPDRKGPVPKELKYKLAEGTKTYNNEIFSIDGERYPAQDVTAKVLKQVFPIYV